MTRLPGCLPWISRRPVIDQLAGRAQCPGQPKRGGRYLEAAGDGRGLYLEAAGDGCGLYLEAAGDGCGLYLEPAGERPIAFWSREN